MDIALHLLVPHNVSSSGSCCTNFETVAIISVGRVALWPIMLVLCWELVPSAGAGDTDIGIVEMRKCLWFDKANVLGTYAPV